MSHDPNERLPIYISEPEFNAIACGLRLLQVTLERGDEIWDDDILTKGSEQKALTPDEIGDLCEDMNTGRRETA